MHVLCGGDRGRESGVRRGRSRWPGAPSRRPGARRWFPRGAFAAHSSSGKRKPVVAVVTPPRRSPSPHPGRPRGHELSGARPPHRLGPQAEAPSPAGAGPPWGGPGQKLTRSPAPRGGRPPAPEPSLGARRGTALRPAPLQARSGAPRGRLALRRTRLHTPRFLDTPSPRPQVSWSASQCGHGRPSAEAPASPAQVTLQSCRRPARGSAPTPRLGRPEGSLQEAEVPVCVVTTL